MDWVALAALVTAILAGVLPFIEVSSGVVGLVLFATRLAEVRASP